MHRHAQLNTAQMPQAMRRIRARLALGVGGLESKLACGYDDLVGDRGMRPRLALSDRHSRTAVPIENNYITGFDFLLHRLAARHGPEFAPVNRAVEFARIDEDVYQTVRRGHASRRQAAIDGTTGHF